MSLFFTLPRLICRAVEFVLLIFIQNIRILYTLLEFSWEVWEDHLPFDDKGLAAFSLAGDHMLLLTAHLSAEIRKVFLRVFQKELKSPGRSYLLWLGRERCLQRCFRSPWRTFPSLLCLFILKDAWTFGAHALSGAKFTFISPAEKNITQLSLLILDHELYH